MGGVLLLDSLGCLAPVGSVVLRVFEGERALARGAGSGNEVFIGVEVEGLSD
jgi:hypothetical protein